MKKYNSGTNSATGLTGSGLRDWMVQRVSAVILAVYSLVLLFFFLLNGQVDYEAWHGFMMSLPMRLFTLVTILALAGHAWVGMWTIFTDYITVSKLGPAAASIRMILQAAMILAVLAFTFWGLMIFWG